MRAAAVFDLDRTLLPGTSAERLFAPWLLRRGAIGPRQVAAFLATALTLPLRGPGAALRRNKGYLRGVEADALEPCAEGFVAEVVAPRLDPVVVGELERARGEGRLTCLLTGAPAPVARAVARRLGIEVVVATELEVRAGRYTGRIVGRHPFGAEKAWALDALARRYDLDLTRSSAYADHGSDVALLSRVGAPVAVAPDRGLRREAERRGWRVLGGARPELRGPPVGSVPGLSPGPRAARDSP